MVHRIIRGKNTEFWLEFGNRTDLDALHRAALTYPFLTVKWDDLENVVKKLFDGKHYDDLAFVRSVYDLLGAHAMGTVGYMHGNVPVLLFYPTDEEVMQVLLSKL